MWRQATGRRNSRQPTREEIAARAYLKHLEHPSAVDRAVDDWLQAEHELVGETASTAR